MQKFTQTPGPEREFSVRYSNVPMTRPVVEAPIDPAQALTLASWDQSPPTTPARVRVPR